MLQAEPSILIADLNLTNEDEIRKFVLSCVSWVRFAETYFKNPDEPELQLRLEYGQKKAIYALQFGYDIDSVPDGYIIFAPPKIVIMIWPRQFGKCLTPDTKIQLSDGSLKRIDELKQDSVISYDGVKFVKSEPVISFYNGDKECLEIKTKSGRKIKCSLNHPFYAFVSYKEPIKYVRAEDLRIGNKVSMCRELPLLGETNLSNQEISFIAYMITEGGLTNWPPRFTNKNHDIVSHWKKIVKNWAQVKCNGDLTISYTCKNKQLKTLLINLGLKDKLAKDKFIPDIIFKSTNTQIALFLSKMIDCDGSVSKKVIEYSSCSNRLIEDISYLFSRIGMFGKIVKTNNQYRLIFTSSLSFLNAKKHLNLIPYKQKILDSINFSSNDHIDTFPINKQVIDFLKQKNLTRREFEKKLGFKINYNNSGYCLKKVEKIKNTFPEFKIDTSIYWDEIISIKNIGINPTYGVEVPKYHNHLTNGFLTHNTTGVAVAAAVILCLHPGVRIGLMGMSEESAKNLIDRIRWFLENSPFKKHIERNLKMEIIMDHGGLVRAHTTSHSIRGQSYHFLILDEAAQIEDEIIEGAALDTTRKIGKRVVMLSTPFGYRGVLVKYYQQGLRTRGVVCAKCHTQFTMGSFSNVRGWDAMKMPEDLPKCPECGSPPSYFYVPGDYTIISIDPFTSTFYTKEEILKELDRRGNTPLARQELLGEIIPEGQSVFRKEWIDQCINQNLKNIMKHEENIQYMIGIDFGKAHDNSVIAVGHDIGDGRIRLDYIRVIPSDVKGKEYEDIRNEILEVIMFYKPVWIIPDSTGIGDPIVEQLDKDLRLVGWRGRIYDNKTNRRGFVFDVKTKPDLIENLVEYFARGRIEMPPEYEPDIDKFINEALNFSYEMTEANYIKYGIQLEHDDTVIAVALMVWGHRHKPWIWAKPTFTLPRGNL